MKSIIEKYKYYIIGGLAVLLLILLFTIVNSTRKNYKRIQEYENKIETLNVQVQSNIRTADYWKQLRKQDSVLLTIENAEKVRLFNELEKYRKTKPKPANLNDSELQRWYMNESGKYTKLRFNLIK